MKLAYLGAILATLAGMASADYCKCSDGQPGTPEIDPVSYTHLRAHET